MGNFHCIPSSCGTVTYREYLPPVVRWRYPGEEWQEIEGDDYAIETTSDELPTDKYIFWRASVLISRFGKTYRKEISVRQRGSSNSSSIPVGKPLFETASPSANSGGKDRLYIDYDPPNPITWYHDFGRYNYPISWEFYDICIVNRADAISCENGTQPISNCKFTITNNSQIIHQETRDTCPEVEKLPCRLSEKVNKIKVEKISYYQGIEIVNFARDTIFTVEIPQNCLNIYNTNLQLSIIPLPDIYPDYNFVDQICSFPGCPPPKYEVICDCNDCESCPENTCAVECEGNICCYDKITGKSIKSIPIDNYCRDEL